MGRGIFVTGTDTGVGKTLIAAGILRGLRSRGIDAVPMKPVQTGGELRGGRLIAPDLDFALRAAGLAPDEDEERLMSPYVYEPACSPHLAGRLAKHYVQPSFVKGCLGTLLLSHQAVVVEGAGGIMVPLNENETMLDLMKLLALPVVLVARFGLGTINHTLLSVQALRAAGLTVVGVVFNQVEAPSAEDGFIADDNPAAIAHFGEVPILGRVGYLDISPDKEQLWRDFEEAMTGMQAILDAVGG
jgi:dethiobiotin synthase